MYGSRTIYVIIRTSFFHTSYEVSPKWDQCSYELSPKFVWSWSEVHSKLPQILIEVAVKFIQSWSEVCTKMPWISFEVQPIDRSLSLAPALLGSEHASYSCTSSFGSEELASTSQAIWLHSVSTVSSVSLHLHSQFHDWQLGIQFTLCFCNWSILVVMALQSWGSLDNRGHAFFFPTHQRVSQESVAMLITHAARYFGAVQLIVA